MSEFNTILTDRIISKTVGGTIEVDSPVLFTQTVNVNIADAPNFKTDDISSYTPGGNVNFSSNLDINAPNKLIVNEIDSLLGSTTISGDLNVNSILGVPTIQSGSHNLVDLSVNENLKVNAGYILKANTIQNVAHTGNLILNENTQVNGSLQAVSLNSPLGNFLDVNSDMRLVSPWVLLTNQIQPSSLTRVLVNSDLLINSPNNVGLYTMSPSSGGFVTLNGGSFRISNPNSLVTDFISANSNSMITLNNGVTYGTNSLNFGLTNGCALYENSGYPTINNPDNSSYKLTNIDRYVNGNTVNMAAGTLLGANVNYYTIKVTPLSFPSVTGNNFTLTFTAGAFGTSPIITYTGTTQRFVKINFSGSFQQSQGTNTLTYRIFQNPTYAGATGILTGTLSTACGFVAYTNSNQIVQVNLLFAGNANPGDTFYFGALASANATTLTSTFMQFECESLPIGLD